MEKIPLLQQDGYQSDFRAGWTAVEHGVVDANNETRRKFWKDWCNYIAPFHISPYLDEPGTDNILILVGFAERVRTGYFGRGKAVGVQQVTVALRAVGKTCKLAGKPNPVYRAEQKYLLPIERQVECYRREDPPPVPELAVPVAVPNWLFQQGLTSRASRKTEAVGLQVMIGFYFLLRVGEYTNTRRNKSPTGTRTKQFQVKDIGFWKDGNVLPRRSNLETLLTADEATMIISNQKNGVRGDQLHHESNGTTYCPVGALARRVHHILSNGGTEDSVLSTYFDDNGDELYLQGDDIVKAVRLAVTALNLPQAGIKAEQVGSHSLRASGAMAMKLNGSDRDTIRKFGRWNSDTFLMYIHNQIAHFSAGVSKRMARFVPFRNIAGIEGRN